LIDPEIVDDAIRLHLTSGADYTTNTLQRTYPAGQDVEILTKETLTRVWKHAKLLSEREHVTIYIPKHPDQFHIQHLEYKEDLSQNRWTLDYPEDHELVHTIFKNLYPRNPIFGMNDTLDFLSGNPELEKINGHISVDAGVQRSLRQDRIITFQD
jgi:spore coat polysaccharide biosynthesis protein SpsF